MSKVISLSEAVGIEAEIEFESIGCRVSLSEVYDKVVFESDDDPSETTS